MQRADLGKILDVATGSGQSSVRVGADVWQPAGTGKVILCAAFYTDNLKERKVLVDANSPGQLPGVEVQLGSLTEEDFMWVLEMGRTIPTLKAYIYIGPYPRSRRAALTLTLTLTLTIPPLKAGRTYYMTYPHTHAQGGPH